ncbi:MAG TPA: chemotaxis-specific protein-glutamate methyltransferase CheB [Anaeromyxobacter sp.]
MTSPGRILRVLVVDDQAASRVALVRLLQGTANVAVVGESRDGEDALRDVIRLGPDVVVLDLQMPRMDGFTFLRLLMAQRPTPVIVVSSASGKGDVFKSLELGALDFVAKPDPAARMESIRAELLEKLAVVRSLRNLPPALALPSVTPAPQRAVVEPSRIAVVGASTGGPQAVQRVLAGLPHDLPLGMLVAQHMPERFTRAFAERLGRGTRLSVKEAEDGDVVATGRVLVAPGGRHLELRRDAGVLRAAVVEPDDAPGAPRYVPSVDRLFASAARELGARVCGIVLTGMGSDGCAGIAAIKAAGGLTLAESEDSAVVYGMPQSAAASGSVDEVLGLDRIVERIARFARGG